MIKKLWNDFKGFRNYQKRASQIDTAWPFGSVIGSYGQSENLPTVRRCLSIYAMFLNILKLETESREPHYFIDLLNNPHPAFCKSDLMESIAFETLLNGQFIAKLGFNRQTGKIDKIYPYRNNTARAYAVKGDYADPEMLDKAGFYYRSNYSGKVFWPDEALHIKDGLYSRGDLLNGFPRSYYFKTLFEMGISVLNVTTGLAKSGGRGAILIEGLPMDSAEKSKEIRDRVQAVLQSGLQASTNQVMGMPSGAKPHRLLADQSHFIFQWLAERSDLELAKIFDVPFEILQVGKIGAQSLKEVWRGFIRISLRNFLDKVAQAFTKSVGDGTQFVFRPGKFRFSDAREAGMYYQAMLQYEVLTANEVKEMLEE